MCGAESIDGSRMKDKSTGFGSSSNHPSPRTLGNYGPRWGAGGKPWGAGSCGVEDSGFGMNR